MTLKRFIHIPKNGGMSIRHHCKDKTKLTTWKDVDENYANNFRKTMEMYNEHPGIGHARWRDLLPHAQSEKCFAVVRNPWSRVVSRYTFLMHSLEHNKSNIHERTQYTKVTFEEFLDQRHEDFKLPFFWHKAIRGWHLQKDYVTDENNELKCDILRLGEGDVEQYLNLKTPLSRRNISNSTADYRTFYTNHTKQIVAEWYGDDIEFFGFTFDGSATKNIWMKEKKK